MTLDTQPISPDIYRGLFEMQAQILHLLQSMDIPDKDKLYKAITEIDVIKMASNLKCVNQ